MDENRSAGRHQKMCPSAHHQTQPDHTCTFSRIVKLVLCNVEAIVAQLSMATVGTGAGPSDAREPDLAEMAARVEAVRKQKEAAKREYEQALRSLHIAEHTENRANIQLHAFQRCCPVSSLSDDEGVVLWRRWAHSRRNEAMRPPTLGHTRCQNPVEPFVCPSCVNPGAISTGSGGMNPPPLCDSRQHSALLWFALQCSKSNNVLRFVAMTICLCRGGYMRMQYPLLMAPLRE